MEELKRRRGVNYEKLYPRLCSIFNSMRSRCNNPNRPKYKDYGARGIRVCEEWKHIRNFINWALNNGYEDKKQLDRIDNNGNYEPLNCRWVYPKQNSRNRRNTKYLTLHGITKCVAAWCEKINVSEFTVYWWYREKGKEYTERRLEAIME